jgi:hypothetical protein
MTKGHIYYLIVFLLSLYLPEEGILKALFLPASNPILVSMSFHLLLGEPQMQPPLIKS